MVGTDKMCWESVRITCLLVCLARYERLLICENREHTCCGTGVGGAQQYTAPNEISARLQPSTAGDGIAQIRPVCCVNRAVFCSVVAAE